MSKPLVHKEIQRPIGDGGLFAKARLGQFVEHFIGAHRPVFGQEDFERGATLRRELGPRGGADDLGLRQRVIGADTVIMGVKGFRRVW